MPLRMVLNRFLDILTLEIEDLENDILDLVQLAKDRLERHEITNYVFLANKGVLLNQLACLKTLMGTLRSLDTRGYADVKQLVADVERRMRDCLASSEYPEAVFSLVKRRIDKVYRYLTQEE